MHRQNWDDLRFVLAVAETGSLSAAARLLGVNHATVLRRVHAFEDAQGGPVFARTAHGYDILPERARVIEAARDVAGAFDQVAHLMQGSTAPLRGTVRITATDTLCSTILPKIAAQMMARADGLHIELSMSNQHADFARLQSDIAVRPAVTLPDDMRGDVACDLGFALYATPDCAADRWLGLAGPLARARPAAWLSDTVPRGQIVAGSDSFVTLRDMAAQGIGRCILPCILGEAEPRLVRQPGFPEMAVPLWVASHVDLFEAPRIRVVRDRLLRRLVQNAAALGGLISG